MQSPEESSLRSHRNEYHGYAAGPIKRIGSLILRFDFDSRISTDENRKATLNGFGITIMERPEDVEYPESRAEMGVLLTVEQWQDLISAMQEELKLAREWRDKLEGL